jgi:hypothetical protein
MITHGNIIIIHIDDIEPSMAIIPKIDFQVYKINDIFEKIKNLQKKFPNCNFKKYSLLFENKYTLQHQHKNRNITLSKWFQKNKIPKDENNNYIFYVNSKNSIKLRKSRKMIPKKNPKNKSRKSKDIF